MQCTTRSMASAECGVEGATIARRVGPRVAPPGCPQFARVAAPRLLRYDHGSRICDVATYARDTWLPPSPSIALSLLKP